MPASSAAETPLAWSAASSPPDTTSGMASLSQPRIRVSACAWVSDSPRIKRCKSADQSAGAAGMAWVTALAPRWGIYRSGIKTYLTPEWLP